MIQNLERIYDVLKKDKRLVAKDGSILKNKVYEFALKMDKELLKILVEDKLTKEMFFTDNDGILIFDKVKFGWVVDSKDFLPDSYTRYKNNIMLVDKENKSLRKSNDVVLHFPFKDCVLEGGQKKENEERKEKFYNEVLGKSEIDTLLDRKVITNAKRYKKNNIEEITKISDEDNLLVKGNNLIALSTLRSNYSNKIKCSYWDVPYNTGSDSFNYNDNFNRSTYLTFIKNRVDILKELLSDDGVLLLQCSFHQYAYLKVLLDEIMAKHIMTFNVLVRHPDRILTGDKEFNDVIEHVLVYSKTPDFKMPKISKIKSIEKYVYTIKELKEGKDIEFDGKKAKMFLPDEYKLVKGEPSEEKFKTISIRGSIKEKNSSGRFYMKHLNNLVEKYPPLTLFKVEGIGDDIYDYRYFHLPKKNNKNGTYLQGKPTSSNITYKPYPNFVDFKQEYNVVGGEGDVEFRNGKKPEELIKYFLDIFTEEGDIVLDAFMGSGTTGVVSLKMNRQFIGIEQMDYIEDVTIKRLSKLVNGDSTDGISYNFNGNESFIYFELKELDKIILNKILNAKTDEDLTKIFNLLKESPYINYRVNLVSLRNSYEEFNMLSIDEKKSILLNIIDKNTIYISYSNIEDSMNSISDEEKELNYNFYND